MSHSLGIASARITLDTSDLSGKADGAISKMQQLESAASKAASGGITGLAESIVNNKDQLTSWGKTMVGVGGVIMGAIATPMIAGANAAWKQVDSVEQATVALKAYEKDGTKVNAVLSDLIGYAQSDLGVLFQRTDLFESAQALKLYGAETDNLSGYVQVLSRSVGLGLSNWDDLNRVVGRVGSTGRLTGNDFDYLKAAGFQLDDSLRNTNMTWEELFQHLDKGMPVDALAGQADTIRGKTIRLQSALRNLGLEFLGVDKETSKFIKGGLGDTLVKALDQGRLALLSMAPAAAIFGNAVAAAARVVSSVIGVILKLPQPIKTAILVFTGLTGALLTAGGTFLLLLPRIASTYLALQRLGGVTGIIRTLSTALRALTLSSPLFLVLAAAVGAFLAYKNNFLGFADGVNAVGRALGNLGIVKSVTGWFRDLMGVFGAFSTAFAALDTKKEIDVTVSGDDKYLEWVEQEDGSIKYAIFRVEEDGSVTEFGEIIESYTDESDPNIAHVKIKGDDGEYWTTIDKTTGELGDGTITVTAETTEARSGINRLRDGLKALENAAKKADMPILASAAGLAIKAVDGVEKLNKAFGKLGPTVKKTTNALRTSFASARKQGLDPFRAGMQAVHDTFPALRGAIDRITPGIDKLYDGFSKIRRGDIAAGFRDIGSVLASVGRSFGSLAASVGSWVLNVGVPRLTGWLSDTAGSIWESLTEAAGWAWDGLVDIKDWTLDVAAPAVTGWLNDHASGVWDALTAAAGWAWGGLASLGSWVLETAVPTVSGWLAGAASNAWEALKSVAGWAWDNLVNLGSIAIQIAGWLVSAARNIGSSIKTWILETAWPTAKNAIHNLGDVLVRIADWIVSSAKFIGGAIKDWITGTAWPTALGIIHNLGSVLVKIADWVVSSAKYIGTAIRDWVVGTAWPLAQAAITNIGSVLVKIGDWLVSSAKYIGNSIKSFVTDTAWPLAEGLIHDLGTVATQIVDWTVDSAMSLAAPIDTAVGKAYASYIAEGKASPQIGPIVVEIVEFDVQTDDGAFATAVEAKVGDDAPMWQQVYGKAYMYGFTGAQKLVDKINGGIKGFGDGITGGGGGWSASWLGLGAKLAVAAGIGLVGGFDGAMTAASNATRSIPKTFYTSIIEPIGKGIIEDATQGFANMFGPSSPLATLLKNAFKGVKVAWNQAINDMKNLPKPNISGWFTGWKIPAVDDIPGVRAVKDLLNKIVSVFTDFKWPSISIPSPDIDWPNPMDWVPPEIVSFVKDPWGFIFGGGGDEFTGGGGEGGSSGGTGAGFSDFGQIDWSKLGAGADGMKSSVAASLSAVTETIREESAKWPLAVETSAGQTAQAAATGFATTGPYVALGLMTATNAITTATGQWLAQMTSGALQAVQGAATGFVTIGPYVALGMLGGTNAIRTATTEWSTRLTTATAEMSRTVATAMSTIGREVTTGMTSATRTITSESDSSRTALTRNFDQARDAVRNAMREIASNVQSNIRDAANAARTGANDVRNAISNGMSEATSAVRNQAGQWAGIINGAAGSMGAAGFNAGAAAGFGVANGMLSALGSITSAANSIVSEVDRALTAAAKIASPAKRFKPHGEMITRGASAGMTSSGALKSIGAAAATVMDTIDRSFSDRPELERTFATRYQPGASSPAHNTTSNISNSSTQHNTFHISAHDTEGVKQEIFAILRADYHDVNGAGR